MLDLAAEVWGPDADHTLLAATCGSAVVVQPLLEAERPVVEAAPQVFAVEPQRSRLTRLVVRRSEWRDDSRTAQDVFLAADSVSTAPAVPDSLPDSQA